MDYNLLYKLIGHASIGIDKTLTRYAVDAYNEFTKNISNRLASLYIDLLLQACDAAGSDVYFISSVLNLGSLTDILITMDNFGCHVGGMKWDLIYTYSDKDINLSHATRKSCMFNRATIKTRNYLVKVVSDTLYEVTHVQHLDQSANATLSFVFQNKCMDTSASQRLFDTYGFHILTSRIKDTPSSSAYTYQFTWKYNKS